MQALFLLRKEEPSEIYNMDESSALNNAMIKDDGHVGRKSYQNKNP